MSKLSFADWLDREVKLFEEDIEFGRLQIPEHEFRMINDWLAWWGKKLVCFVCSGDMPGDYLFVYKPRSRNRAAMWLKHHRKCGHYG